MPITLARDGLLSRAVRKAVAGKNLTRRLNLSSRLEANKNQNGQGKNKFFQTLLSWGKRFVGFLSSAIFGQRPTSATDVFSGAVSPLEQFLNFDWAASDREIQTMIDNNNTAMYGIWGGVAGAGAGSVVAIAVGAGITMAIPVIGSAKLAKIVAGKATLEAAQEFGNTFRGALQATARLKKNNALMNAYRRARKLFGYNPPDEAPVSSINTFLDQKIEGIKNPRWRNFWSSFRESFFDSFIETGYIFAYELDAQLAAQKLAQEKPDTTIRLYPDKRIKEESIVLAGDRDTLKTTIQTTLAQHRMIYNRDVGQIVGMPAEDWVRAKPHRRKLTIVFKELEKPPYRKANGSRVVSATYTIPEPKTGLSWARIKRAARTYNWGKFRCTANLTNGRQMAVYGATARDAETKLKDLLELSTCEIQTLSVTEEKDRNIKLRKNATRMYPSTGSLLIRRESPNPKVGRSTSDGKTWDETIVRFDLWPNEEPEDFKSIRW